MRNTVYSITKIIKKGTTSGVMIRKEFIINMCVSFTIYMFISATTLFYCKFS
jgi:hypothetical protein